MRNKYSEKLHAFIKDNIVGRSTKEIIQLVKDNFGIEFTDSAMRSYKKNHNLKSGTPGGFQKGHSFIFPDKIQDFIKNNFLNIGNLELTQKINEKFKTNYTKGQIKAYKQRLKLNSGLNGYFEKGHVPINKGQKMSAEIYNKCKKTMFKKGNKPHNHKPVGSERIDSKDGYLLVKIAEPNKWRPKHLLIWEEHNGKVPQGSKILFLDGNKQNLKIENLACVSNDELLYLNRKKLITDSPEFTQVGINIAKVQTTISKKIKEAAE